MNAGRLDGAKRAFFTALSIDMAVTVVVAASDYWIVGVLNAVAAGGPPASSSVVGRIQFLESFSGVLILTMLGVGWTLIRWLDACYAHARDTLRARGLQHEKWKTWGWMVPFLNLFKPYQVLSEIFKVGTAGAGRDDWKKASGSGALLAWWIFWTVAHLVMMTIGKAVLKSSSIEGLTLNQIVGIKELQIALCLISLSVAGLWFVVAEKLTSRLVACLQKPASRVTSSSSAFVGDVRTGNDAYAGALAEIEEGRLDKGAWARAFADAGGDEPKAKALYIKARAGASANAEVWEDTQPTAADDTGTYAAVEKPRDEFGNPVPVSTPKWPIWIVAGALPVYILVSLAVSAFRAIPSGQVEAEAATGSQPMAQAGPAPGDGDLSPAAKPVPDGPWSEFRPVDPKLLTDQETMRSAGIGGNQGASDVVAWADAKLEARTIGGNNRQIAHKFAILWQYQLEKKGVAQSAHALFLGYQIVLGNFDSTHRLCKPDASRDGGITARADGNFIASPECYGMGG